MSFKPWQPRTLHGELVEIGPSTGDADATKFSYLEFRNGERIRNVGVFSDMLSKLRDVCEVEDCTFHILEGQHVQSGDVASMLIALGKPSSPIYGIDLNARGSADAMSSTIKVRKLGKFMQWGGLCLIICSIPLVMALIGIPMIGGGILIWRSGKKMAAAMQYQLEMLQQSALMLSRIPNIRLL